MAQVVHHDGGWQGTVTAPASVPEEATAPQENAAPVDEYQAPVDTTDESADAPKRSLSKEK